MKGPIPQQEDEEDTADTINDVIASLVADKLKKPRVRVAAHVDVNELKPYSEIFNMPLRYFLLSGPRGSSTAIVISGDDDIYTGLAHRACTRFVIMSFLIRHGIAIVATRGQRSFPESVQRALLGELQMSDVIIAMIDRSKKKNDLSPSMLQLRNLRTQLRRSDWEQQQ